MRISRQEGFSCRGIESGRLLLQDYDGESKNSDKKKVSVMALM